MSTRTRASTSSGESTVTRKHELGPCKLDKCRTIQTTIKLRNGKRLESRYCHKHTCKVGWGCEEPVHKSHEMYCKMHRTCAEDGCKAEGRNLTECASEWYCPKHECRTQGCYKPQFPLHNHNPPPMPVPPPMATVIKCTMENCNHPSLNGFDLCGNHKCTIAECQDGQHFPNGRCVVHQPCQAPGCPGCGRWNSFHRRAERFCWQHEKCAMLTCGAVVGADDVLCPMHKCGLGGCKAEKYVWETKSNWCRVHTCGTKNCPNPIENREYPPATATSILFRHCKEHTCNRPNCLNEAAVQNGPCARHSCAAPDCNHNVYEPHIFCRNHECRDDDCIEESSPEPHVQFCTERHACRWLNDGTSCDKPREMFGPYPDFCGFHSHRQSELNGAERGRREAEEQARTEAAASGAPPTPETTPPRSHDNRSRQEEYRTRKRPQRERQRSPEWASDDFSDGDPRYPPYQRQYGRWD